jgi:hypothetical protein
MSRKKQRELRRLAKRWCRKVRRNGTRERGRVEKETV